MFLRAMYGTVSGVQRRCKCRSYSHCLEALSCPNFLGHACCRNAVAEETPENVAARTPREPIELCCGDVNGEHYFKSVLAWAVRLAGVRLRV